MKRFKCWDKYNNKFSCIYDADTQMDAVRHFSAELELPIEDIEAVEVKGDPEYVFFS